MRRRPLSVRCPSRRFVVRRMRAYTEVRNQDCRAQSGEAYTKMQERAQRQKEFQFQKLNAEKYLGKDANVLCAVDFLIPQTSVVLEALVVLIEE